MKKHLLIITTMWAILFLTVQLFAQTPARILVWEDQFNGPSINTSIWKNDLGDGCNINNCGWGNQELEFYTNRAENARIENGSLVIEARREAFQGKSFTSARLKTEGLLQFKYGTIEARIKMPNVQNGLWPALWTLGATGGIWPANGEIDIAELGLAKALIDGVGNKQVGGATHWSVAGRTGDHSDSRIAPANLSDDFHVYKMEWTPQFITMFLDGVEYFKFDIRGGAAADLSEFHNPHYLLLNLAVGGSYTGILNAAGITAPLPGKMLVDYIKLFQGEGDQLMATAPAQTPLTPAITPTTPAIDVVSLFSNAYPNRPVSTWSASWDNADVADLQLAGNATKLYTKLNFAGIEFINSQINASNLTHLHIDIWTPNSTTFKVKLVDFGANLKFGGGDDKEHELTFTPTKSLWGGYDIKLSDFTNLASRANLAQLILSGSNSTMYVDNVYFYKKL